MRAAAASRAASWACWAVAPGWPLQEKSRSLSA